MRRFAIDDSGMQLGAPFENTPNVFANADDGERPR
jgi:hypothetical protein